MHQRGILHLFVVFNVVSSFEIFKFVKRGERALLNCDVRKASPPVVTWIDKIFSYKSSIDIYTIDINGNRMNTDHPKIKSFVLDPGTLALSITNMTDEFVGAFVCLSHVGNNVFTINYTLGTYSPLTCSNTKSTYHADQELNFKCKIGFSGKSPELSMWKDNAKLEQDNSELKSSDDIDFSEYEYKHILTPEDNGKSIGCRADMEGIKEECNAILNVTYLTRRVSFEPEGDNLTVGEKVTCKADGNPAPNLIIHKEKDEALIRGFQGVATIEILPDWEDREVKIHCIAENKPGTSVSNHKTIYVSGPKSGGLHSSTEVRMPSLKFVLNGLLAVLLSFILH